MTKRTPPGLEHLAVAALAPYARNARTHGAEQIAQIAASIREYGFTNPVLIDADNGIIAGHGRVMAAGQLGLETVPCLRLSHLTEAQRRAYVIADNQIALNAGWDEEMLRQELLDLRGLDYGLDILGFDLRGLQDIMLDDSDLGLGGTGKRRPEADDGGDGLCACPKCGTRFKP